jgi:hypothetical protein
MYCRQDFYGCSKQRSRRLKLNSSLEISASFVVWGWMFIHGQCKCPTSSTRAEQGATSSARAHTQCVCVRAENHPISIPVEDKGYIQIEIKTEVLVVKPLKQGK